MNYRKVLFLHILVVLSLLQVTAQKVIRPSVQSTTTFAIVIDSISYEHAQVAVHAYRDVVEADQLGTFLIIDNWERPEEVRTALQKIYEQTNQTLEGCVLIGDIPIPMIRDAQHLTTAFKMDQERYPWHRSSVPSDRYYDCFGLSFDFLKTDEDNPRLFYYSLRHDSEQTLRPTIYSSRIRTYDTEQQNRYQALEQFLEKVVKVRSGNKSHALNHLLMVRGHGYNSDSKDGWAGEYLALREQFPLAFTSSGKVKTMNHDQQWPLKRHILTELQQPSLDLAIFHHHGSVFRQYINGYNPPRNAQTFREELTRTARSRVRKLKEGETQEQAIARVVEEMDLPPTWIENAFAPEVVEADSLLDASLDIYPEEIQAISPIPPFIVLDACFTGAFQHDGSISSQYIFNDGSTLAIQANTVNVLQDKWANRYLGLLSGGLRLGNWHKMVMTLETHLIGDPTFRFSNTLSLPFDINSALLHEATSPNFWHQVLESESADLQSLALRMLHQMQYDGIPEVLYSFYHTSPCGIVRMEALELLSQTPENEYFTKALQEAVDDSYELIRRRAVELIGLNGSPELLPALVHSLLWDTTSERIQFKLSQATYLMSTDALEKELATQVAENPFYTQEQLSEHQALFDRNRDRFQRTLKTIQPTERTEKTRRNQIFDLRTFRNNPSAKGMEALIQIATDTGEHPEVRLVAIEALGWYNYSYRKAELIQHLRPLTEDTNPSIAHEAEKTIQRLK